MTIKVGVIGAGRIGKVHAETVIYRIPEAEVVAIADVAEDAARHVAETLRIPHVTRDYREIMADPGVDAVLVCSSTDTHTPVCIEAAQAGKHIFTEKPIDHDLKRIDSVLAAVKAAGVKFQVGFNRRFDPTFARVHQAIQSGEIGDLHLLHIISRDPAPPPVEYVKVSGGLFLDMMIHDFDMARFLVGAEVEEVYTRAAVRVDPAIGAAGDVDTAVVVLTFANGVIATIDNSRRAVYGYDQRVEALGSGGGISTANVYPNEVTVSTGEHVRRDLPLNFFMDRYTASYEREVRAFFDAIVHDTPVPVGGPDGRVPVVMGLAARKSLQEHRPVRLSEVE